MELDDDTVGVILACCINGLAGKRACNGVLGISSAQVCCGINDKVADVGFGKGAMAEDAVTEESVCLRTATLAVASCTTAGGTVNVVCGAGIGCERLAIRGVANSVLHIASGIGPAALFPCVPQGRGSKSMSACARRGLATTVDDRRTGFGITTTSFVFQLKLF